MSLEAIVWAWKQPVKDHGELLVLLSLADYANQDGQCWPSHKTLMAKCRIKSNRTICTKLNSLTEKGFISRHRRPVAGGGSSSNLYQLNLSETVNITVSESVNATGSESVNNDESVKNTDGQNVKDAHGKVQKMTAPESASDASSFSIEPVSKSNQSVKQPVSKSNQSEALKAHSQTTPDPVSELFSYWQQIMDHPQARLDDKRKKSISKALKMGYSVDDLKSAILGCSFTPHNIGINDRSQRYDGLHVILKDADQIDRFIRNAKSPPLQNRQTVQDQLNNHAASEWAEKKKAELRARTQEEGHERF